MEHQRSPGSPESAWRVPTAGEPPPVQRRFVQCNNQHEVSAVPLPPRFPAAMSADPPVQPAAAFVNFFPRVFLPHPDATLETP